MYLEEKQHSFIMYDIYFLLLILIQNFWVFVYIWCLVLMKLYQFQKITFTFHPTQVVIRKQYIPLNF
jgi:hypothetical protein